MDSRGSGFAALATQVNPAARPARDSNLSLSVQAVPRAVDFPDFNRSASSSSLFYLQSLTDSSTDVDYGALSYPQFHNPLWTEMRQVIYNFDVDLVPPGGMDPIRVAASATRQDPMSPAPMDPIGPVVGPPTAPLLNGMDAFVARSGVGSQPTVSWSPPSLGAPTSYVVTIDRAFQLPPAPGELGYLSATVYRDTAFTVPPGFLQAGTRILRRSPRGRRIGTRWTDRRSGMACRSLGPIA